MKRNLYIMYAISFLQGMVFYGPIATLYRQAQGVSIFQITMIESISLALGILLEIPWGIVADKIGYRKTMIFCSVIYFVSKIVFWKATGFSFFLLERILLSIVIAGFSGVDSSIIYLSCEGTDSQKAFGIYNSMGMFGLLSAAGIFSLFIKDNYPLAGFMTVISYGIAALLSFFIMEVKHSNEEKSQTVSFKEAFHSIRSNKTFVLFLIAAAFLSETHQTITVFLNQLQYERAGLQSSAIGIFYIIATLLGLLGIYSPAFTKRMGMRRSLLSFCCLPIVSCILLALTSHVLPSVISIWTLRISDTFFQPFQAEIQNRQVRTKNRATELSINSMFISCIAIGTNLIFGTLSDWYLPSAFFFGSIICTFSLLLFLFWHQKK